MEQQSVDDSPFWLFAPQGQATFRQNRGDLESLMLPPNPVCLITGTKIVGLKATVLLLLALLMKSKILRLKMSLLGSFIGFCLLVSFLISTGVLTVVAGGAVAFAAMQSNKSS